MGHVLLPKGWKEFTYQKGCSYNMKSIMEHGLVAGGKQSREGRQTVLFSFLHPCGQDNEEEPIHDDMTVPRKFHDCSKWRHDQDAVCWVKWKEAQYLGLQCWQTKSDAIVVYQHVPSEWF